MRIAFIVDTFPVVSETFIINQVADLLDRGVDVDVFAFNRGEAELASNRYAEYRMSERTHYLDKPRSKLGRCLLSFLPAVQLLLRGRILRYLRRILAGGQAGPLQLLYGAAWFSGRRFDLIHCHFGTTAVQFLAVMDVLGLETPLVTSLYGYDVSFVFRESPAGFYDRLKRECSRFFVMSNDMKRRVLAHGFPEEKVTVLPVSIDVAAYPFSERRCRPGAPVEILSVGRMVEKKGFDDLLRALAIVKSRTGRAFHCSIVGGGELAGPMRELASSLGLDERVEFKGSMKLDDILALLPRMHLLVAASKTAADGDME